MHAATGGPLPAFGPTVAGGSIAGHPSPTFLLVAREKGDVRVLVYGPNLPAEPRITGHVHATRTAAECSRSGAPPYNGLEKGDASSPQGSVYLHLAAPQSGAGVIGSVRYPNATYAIAGGSIPGASYNAAGTPTLVDVAGEWSMKDFSGRPWKLSIETSGRFTTTDDECSMTGTIAPDSRDNLNLFQVNLNWPYCKRLQFDASPYEGFALFIPMQSGGSRLLFWTAGFGWGAMLDFAGMGQR